MLLVFKRKMQSETCLCSAVADSAWLEIHPRVCLFMLLYVLVAVTFSLLNTIFC